MPFSRLPAFSVFFAAGFAAAAPKQSAATPKESAATIREVTYAVRGDRKLAADVYIPPGPGPFPGVLMVHGGAWCWGGKWQMAGHAGTLVRAGYTVVSINYRFAPSDKFPAQIQDCRDALRWMKRNAAEYKIDLNRIAGYGYSSGGHLVCLLGLAGPAPHQAGASAVSSEEVSRRTDATKELLPPDPSPLPPAKDSRGTGDSAGESFARNKQTGRAASAAESRCGDGFRAIVAGGAPCSFDWVGDDSPILSYFLGGTRREKPEIYQQASPIHFVSADDPPVFLYHGQMDSVIPLSSPQALVERLKAERVRAELYVVEGKGHIGAFFDADAQRRAVQFLDEALGADVQSPSAAQGPFPHPRDLQRPEDVRSERSKDEW